MEDRLNAGRLKTVGVKAKKPEKTGALFLLITIPFIKSNQHISHISTLTN
jgi:hypothetical protein